MTSLLLVELFSLKLLAMASSSASGLKDLLSPQADSNSMAITKPIMKPFQKLEDVSLGSNASLSTLISPPSSPSLQFSLSFASNIDMPLNREGNYLGEKKGKAWNKKGQWWEKTWEGAWDYKDGLWELPWDKGWEEGNER